MKAEKAEIRKSCLTARDAIPTEERIEKSLTIADLGHDAIAFEPGTIISGFMPIRSEVDIRPLMADLRSRGAKLCLPVVLDKETIVFRAFEREAPLIETGFGTMGPGPDAAIVDPEIMLVPLSAFDDQGTRIGYGGGFYDRAIERLHAKGKVPKLIGIAFDLQKVEKVPAEPHDIYLDAILTESGLQLFKE
ncbi:5-formyltetrahydrofolate cyclo-ligase [Rhizobium sp. L1K21]|uniref:5-formyltetrahydrofolate cyclo-ligase n=1 Tax=Rhizobium sp. L1K21 TaxID=2954933 RepID=UPI002093F138|nr:5-formyltetrahydrofolate cyclo-ligase [Rhizobium sp. L1K21]MCO6185077.1 5-formyltetrahydrofolate cyclo-ligase [Rhizobium sp. L1K21]